MKPTWIPLSDPDITHDELDAVSEVLQSPQLSAGPMVQRFEAAFAEYIGRKHAVAVASGTLGLMLALDAAGVGARDEVIASPYSWRECAHAIGLVGATPVFSDIDYWAGTLVPEKAEACLGARTKAIVAGNTNGHPAPWAKLREVAARHRLVLIEDSTEAIGSLYQGKPVGSFGDLSVFDFSQPCPIACGEGGMVVTDDDDYAGLLRRLRSRRTDERASVVFGLTAPYQCGMSDLSAALGLKQLQRIETILEKRKRTERLYFEYVQSFEGIKDPYVAPEVDEVHWFLYLVHLGTRFALSSRDAIVEDLRTESVEAAAYSNPMHLQRRYLELGYRRGSLFVTEKVADRAVALPFHTHLTEEQVAFIIGTMKDASINVGAGTAIYL
ncbi:MAG: DegT/DnrJ/EryC1/StrS family aminotransferase [Hyphomicrobium sp.]|uniref:DegT/DnrJ/EryC1/StrS family aminotransferase n=1 Tax=Hyphomicrobium sp. TaxID=82 RepID=UPI001320CA06|nr:DegT/DnrJ/EryC1/StrS family aminotransferase [Hyphomicrobium sp.]KAB2944006.1 MAG: DegT/DnrJ/EryC1/StrS family aminotransferase [Hyphomicrobium sp.]MBZ0209298.1 DegT/DnrJ/EryC1/StrS family aminotransferase [Hyphomicrobium sp.]